MIKETLLSALEPLNYPCYQQGTIAPEMEYPESFITFEITDSEDQAHFDNMPNLTAWNIAVIFYSIDPALVMSEGRRIYNTLKAAGFIPQGKGADILSDEPTHTGWVNEYKYIESEE